MLNFIVISNKSRNKLDLALWNDVKNKKNVVYLADSYIFPIAFKVLNSKKLNKFLPFFRTIKTLFYSLRYVKLDKNKEYAAIVTSHSLRKLDSDFLLKLKGSNNIKICLILLEPLSKSFYTETTKKIENKIVDVIFSFDNADCRKYGFQYIEQIYSKLPLLANRKSEQFDLYFAGRNKGRSYIIYSFLKFPNLTFKFRLSDFEEADKVKANNILYKKMIPYNEMLQEMKLSNCLLEILQNVQTGITWRYCEAICYNKKLLTTNKCVASTKFYNPNYMHILDVENLEVSIQENLEWIKKVEDINYGYDGSYSPAELFRRVETCL